MPTAPYDVVESVMNLARVRLNDAIQSIGGDVLKDNQPFTLVMLNGAWRRLQSYTALRGFVRLTAFATLTGLPAVLSLDPATFVQLGWLGYINSDGTVTGSFALPQDLIFPTMLSERISGSMSRFFEVDLLKVPLPMITKGQWNGIARWEGDAIKMPGAMTNTDLRVQYAAYLPDFTDLVANPNQPVLILRALSPFAYLLGYEMALSRASLNAQPFLDNAYRELDELIRVRPGG